MVARRRTPSPSRSGPRTVVVAGDDAGPPARQLAEEAGWPLLAEPSSGSRTGANPIRTYRLLLGTDLGERVERVVVFGHPTLSRPVAAAARPRRTSRWSRCRPTGRWPGRPFPVAAEHAARRRPRPTTPPGSRSGARPTGRSAAASTRSSPTQPGLTPYDVAAVVNATNPPGGLLVVGASNPIRDLDLMAAAHPVGERRMVLANRGLAGIDGTLSTAIGAALARDRSTRATAYVGDVTFLHDLTAPGDRPGRAASRPDDRGRQRRRRLDLRDARAGRAGVRRRLRPALRHPPRRRPRRALRAPPAPRTGGSPTGPSSSTRWPAPTAASRWSRPSYAATTAASSTRRSGPWRLTSASLDTGDTARTRDVGMMGRCTPSSPWSASSPSSSPSPASARKLDLPSPLVLIVVGIVGSYLPFVPDVQLEPEVVLFGLLPPLLYAACAADQPGRLQRQPAADPAALGRAGRVHHRWRRGAGARAAARARLAGRVRHRRRGRPAGRGRRDRDRPPDRAAPADRDDPRGRVAAQRRDRAGRAAHRARRHGRVVGLARRRCDFLARGRRRGAGRAGVLRRASASSASTSPTR